ncbi:PEP-CTERM sorting domain-containing protein [Oopsacas minuta]|uniref:PEP-CTERM sorting domain-containing protein n=1 Tax=Oopsacas minuta TaxID=111878 RepID=A0AAV7KJ84_9METZ|nr:PEP-CTERM sorting domain-containing protein [Oopsacas minuta]
MATAIAIETETVKTGIDYTSKIQPLVSASKRGRGSDKPIYPNCVTVDKMTGNLYIADYLNDFVKVFDSTARIGKQGKGELEFNYPYGIAVNESNDDIYICDYFNNRVQILSKDFQFKSLFGSFTHPGDVKLSNEYIYVLDESNPCIHIFNHNFILQKNVISRGQGNPYSFFIDNFNNILIADNSSNSICIFNPEFQ